MEASKQGHESTSGTKTSSSTRDTISLNKKNASPGTISNKTGSKSAASPVTNSTQTVAKKNTSPQPTKAVAKGKNVAKTKAGLAIKTDSGKQQQHAEHISHDQRRQLIETAAYLRAEKRGFNGGDPVDDWLKAESEVDAMLG